MKTDITVTAEPRASRGKNEARRTRREGLIPGVVYGAYKDPVPVAVSPRQISQILHSKTGHNTIFNLDIQGGENTPVMVVDGQHELIRPADAVIAHVIPIKVVVEPTPAEAVAAPTTEAAPTEPEVIKKGKKEEEGAAEGKAEGKTEGKAEAKPKKK